MSRRFWGARQPVTLVLWLALVSMTGVLDGQEVRRQVIKGRVVSVGTEAPVAGATVIIRGVGRATTDASGRYKIRSARDLGILRQVVVTASGHRRRKTWLNVSDSARKTRADWNVMPTTRSPAFDSVLFDEITRRGFRTVGTSRWERVPVVRIMTRMLSCPGAPQPNANCPEWIVSSSPVSSVVMEWFHIVVQDMPALMGGMVPAVETVDLPAGASISTDSVLVAGAITLAQNRDGGVTYFPTVDFFGEPIDEYVHLVALRGGTSAASLLRQVARGFGYPNGGAGAELCADLLERGLRSIHCSSHALEHPSALDAALGRALYTRSVRNRFPDTDPKPLLRTVR